MKRTIAEHPPGSAGAAGATADLADRIVADLGTLFRRQRRSMARNWCLSGVSMTHLHVLVVLDTEGPQPMSRLAASLGSSLPNATGLVDRMVERGLVERVRDEGDRRLVRVRLADEGRRALEQLEVLRQHHLRRILSVMPLRDRRSCAHAFRAMRRAAERLDAEQASDAPLGPGVDATGGARSSAPRATS